MKQILLIEDHPGDARLFIDAVGSRASVFWCSHMRVARNLMDVQGYTPDIIVCDYFLVEDDAGGVPGDSAVAFLHTCGTVWPYTHLVCLSGSVPDFHRLDDIKVLQRDKGISRTKYKATVDEILAMPVVKAE